MEKTVTALFNTVEGLDAARNAAGENGADAEHISVSRTSEPVGAGGKNTVLGIAAGAAVGIIMGLGTLALENMGLISSIGPVAGLISGAVIGAIVGGFMDYEQTIEAPDERWLLSAAVDEPSAGAAARALRRCGGSDISIH